MKSPPTSHAEKRAFGRRETSIGAVVRDGHRIYDCIIRDLSEGGALLEFNSRPDLSTRFWLRWEGMSSDIVCEVRHVNGHRAGVQFSRPIVLKQRPAVAAAELVAPQRGPVRGGNERAKAALALLAAQKARQDATRQAASKVTTGAEPTASSAATAPCEVEEATAPALVIEIAADENPSTSNCEALDHAAPGAAGVAEIMALIELAVTGLRLTAPPRPLSPSAYAEKTDEPETNQSAVPLPLAASRYAPADLYSPTNRAA